MRKAYPQPTRCPVCNGKLHVTQLSCEACGTSLQGHFQSCRFCQLEAEQMQFLEVFLRARGMLAGVERELGISGTLTAEAVHGDVLVNLRAHETD